MASQNDGGVVVPGNLVVFGDASVNGAVAMTESITAASGSFATHIKLIPTASPPAGAAEGMLYADTDHSLYYHNGTDWKAVTVAG